MGKDNFDLRKFLTENKLTTAAKRLNEDAPLNGADMSIADVFKKAGIKLTDKVRVESDTGSPSPIQDKGEKIASEIVKELEKMRRTALAPLNRSEFKDDEEYKEMLALHNRDIKNGFAVHYEIKPDWDEDVDLVVGFSDSQDYMIYKVAESDEEEDEKNDQDYEDSWIDSDGPIIREKEDQISESNIYTVADLIAKLEELGADKKIEFIAQIESGRSNSVAADANIDIESEGDTIHLTVWGEETDYD